jgi:nucleoside-diphosphate-sugar epimerase
MKDIMKKVLITGAGGFAGSALSRYLYRKGYSVIALDRQFSENFEPGAVCIQADLSDTLSLLDIKENYQPEAVIHLAAKVPDASQKDSDPTAGDFIAENLEMSETLFNVFLSPQCPGIFISSGLVYGEQEVSPFVETMNPNPIDDYGLSKWQCEQSLNQLAQSRHSTLTTLRLSVLYGPELKRPMLLNSMVKSLSQGKEFAMTPGEQYRDFLYIEDFCTAMEKVLQQPQKGTFNLSQGNAVTVIEAARTALQIVKEKNPGNPCKLNAGKIPYRTQEVWNYSLDNSKFCSTFSWLPQYSINKGLLALYQGIYNEN